MSDLLLNDHVCGRCRSEWDRNWQTCQRCGFHSSVKKPKKGQRKDPDS